MSPPSNLGPGDWLSFATSLVLVLALMGALYYLAKRIGFKGVGGDAKMDLEVLETHPIGNRQRIVLIRARDREILLGITLQEISLLSTWTKDDLASSSMPPQSDEVEPPKASNKVSFRQLLGQFSIKGQGKQ
jgi:flagellar biosynthetic protein FliO